MKKILILAMSCNQDFFLQQEQNIRNLYAKDILEGKYENIDFWVYTASTDEKYHVNKKQHKLYVPCDDSLSGTYEKTFKTFNLLEKTDIEYDYIFRTNLSTYVNVELLNSWVNSEFIDDKHIYSGSIYCTKNATGPFEYCLYGCGNSLLLPKFWVNIIAHNHVSKYRYINNVVNQDEPYYKIDDNAIGLVVNSYAFFNQVDLEMDMYDVWKNFRYPDPGEIPVDCWSYIAISFREYNPDETRNQEFMWSKMIHLGIQADIGLNGLQMKPEYIIANQCIHIIDFEKGMHSVATRDFADKFLSAMSLPNYIEKLQINNKNFNLIK